MAEYTLSSPGMRMVCVCVCVQNYFQFRDPLDSVLELRAALDFETLPNLTITVVATVRLGTHE